MATVTKIAPKREGQERDFMRKGGSMMRLFSYACKAKDVRKFFATHWNVFQFLLKEYSKNHPATMNSYAERRCRKCMPEQEKTLVLA